MLAFTSKLLDPLRSATDLLVFFEIRAGFTSQGP